MTEQEKYVAAEYINTPTKSLEILAKDEDCYIRARVARNPNASPETLKVLASDEDWVVRCMVAENPNAPLKSLELLATDERYYVRLMVAENPNCNQIIERLVLMTEHQLAQAANPAT